jgi:hypothetical protein
VADSSVRLHNAYERADHIPADHREMVRFKDDSESGGFQKVLAVVTRFVAGATEDVANGRLPKESPANGMSLIYFRVWTRLVMFFSARGRQKRPFHSAISRKHSLCGQGGCLRKTRKALTSSARSSKESGIVGSRWNWVRDHWIGGELPESPTGPIETSSKSRGCQFQPVISSYTAVDWNVSVGTGSGPPVY